MLFIGQIVGVMFTIATFPGVIIHEIAHRFFCDITKTPVYDINYFDVSDLKSAGHVTHGVAKGLKGMTLICLGPLIINTLLCLVFTAPYAMAVAADVGRILGPEHFILIWLGFSIGAHALPSSQDVSNLSTYIDKNHSLMIRVTFFPFRVLFFITNLLRLFWFEVLFSGFIIYCNVKLFGFLLELLG